MYLCLSEGPGMGAGGGLSFERRVRNSLNVRTGFPSFIWSKSFGL